MAIANGQLAVESATSSFDKLARTTHPEFSLDGARRSRALTVLVQTLAHALDIREIFSQLSVAARAVVHHDEAALALFDETGTRLRLYASTSVDAPEDVPPCDARIGWPLDRAGVFHAGPERPFTVGVHAPVGLGGERAGVLVFSSKTPHVYSDTDVWLAERIADGVALALSHQRLAEDARRRAVEREHAANLEASEELLDAIADVLDIREIFPRVSEIAAKVLPHDCLTMSLHRYDGVAIVHATSNTNGPLIDRLRIVLSGMSHADSACITRDLVVERPQIVEPADLPERLVAAGYRSLLAVEAARWPSGIRAAVLVAAARGLHGRRRAGGAAHRAPRRAVRLARAAG